MLLPVSVDCHIVALARRRPLAGQHISSASEVTYHSGMYRSLLMPKIENGNISSSEYTVLLIKTYSGEQVCLYHPSTIQRFIWKLHHSPMKISFENSFYRWIRTLRICSLFLYVFYLVYSFSSDSISYNIYYCIGSRIALTIPGTLRAQTCYRGSQTSRMTKLKMKLSRWTFLYVYIDKLYALPSVQKSHELKDIIFLRRY